MQCKWHAIEVQHSIENGAFTITANPADGFTIFGRGKLKKIRGRSVPEKRGTMIEVCRLTVFTRSDDAFVDCECEASTRRQPVVVVEQSVCRRRSRNLECRCPRNISQC